MDNGSFDMDCGKWDVEYSKLNMVNGKWNIEHRLGIMDMEYGNGK